MSNQIDTSILDVFRAIDRSDMQLPLDIEIPNNFYQQMLDYFLERGYLNTLAGRDSFVDFRKLARENPARFGNIPEGRSREVTWLRVTRLPVHPSESKEYDLLSRWQSVLATLHTWGHRLIFLLQRRGGETSLALGTVSHSRDINAVQALEQFKEAAASGMPGIELCPVLDKAERMQFGMALSEYLAVGTVTGIPSLRKDSQFGVLQTLDQLAFGVRDLNGIEQDYALMVVADPVGDEEITRTLSNYRRLGSEIHLEVKRNVSDTDTISEAKSAQAGIGSVLAGVGSALGMVAPPIAALLGGLGGALNKSMTKTAGTSKAVTTEYLDKFAQYAELITEKHCERLNRGRNLGFWNTGIYVLGKAEKDINTVMGMLRAVYSGDESYVEPIRASLLKGNSGALDIVRRCDLIPLISTEAAPKDPVGHWNTLGRMYQYVSTPLNTEELSIATSLPRRDVPGLRFVKTSVRFANNPAPVDGDTICLGQVVDTGVVQRNEYRIDPNALVRHAIVAGSTGSGKSTTCKAIINEVLGRGVPVMIVEPAKDDYVRWAMKYNESLPEAERETRGFQIFMPGTDSVDGVRVSRLKLSPFQPAAVEGAPIDLLTRCEQATALFNASLPASDVLPVLIDEALYTYMYEQVGEPFLSGDIPQRKDYPRLDGVIATAKRVLANRGYDKKVQDDIRAALETRFAYLTRGKRGAILNVNNSTDYTSLFSRPTVVNLSKIAGAKDKALIMSLLALALYEYRISAYSYDADYRAKAQKDQLLHLAVIEEAHNLLMKPMADTGNSGNPQQVVADLFSNMLSEIRSYGQGMMIVDQIPTRLVPDAIKNTNYKIVHRLTAPDDCAVMSAGLALREDQQAVIPALGVGDAIICGDLDDAAAWVRIPYKR